MTILDRPAKLDLFMGSCDDLSSTRFFTELSSLCVMKQSKLSAISGLEACANLESLWVTECQVTTPTARRGAAQRSVAAA